MDKNEFEAKRQQLLKDFLEELCYLYVLADELKATETLVATIDIIPLDDLAEYQENNPAVYSSFSDN